jgi:hypothetical protein
MPTQRAARGIATGRRARRFLLLAAATGALGAQSGVVLAESACLLLWVLARREALNARRLRIQMISGCFNPHEMSAYDVVSMMRFAKRDIIYISSRIPWREVTSLGQVRTARRRYVASREEATCILMSRLAMPSRIEDLESRFFRSKSSISEIFYEALESFLAWAGPLVSNFQTPLI